MLNNNKKKIGLIIANEGYQQTEYNKPKEILADNGYKVITISDKPTVAIAKDNSTADVDIILDQVNTLDFEAIFLIGGPGALEHLNNQKVYDIFQQLLALKKPFGAICISPRILAQAGVLNGKKATGWNDDNLLENIFNKYYITYQKEAVVVDGNIVTATGPDAAEEFALAILKILGQA